MNDKFGLDKHKMTYHPGRVAAWMRGENIYPIYVEIGTVSTCNHRCIFCALDYTGYKGDSLETNVLKEAISNMAAGGVKSIMFSGAGEPLLHKDFVEIVTHAKRLGIDCALTTNGVMLKRQISDAILPLMSWIKFSVDAGTSQTYSKIHGTKPDDFGNLLENIAYCVQAKKKGKYAVKLGIQMLLINENAGELLLLCNKAKELGVDYFVAKPYSQHPSSKNKQVVDYTKFYQLQSAIEKCNNETFNAIFRIEAMERLKGKRGFDVCHGLPFFALISAEGNVIPCHIFYGKPEYYYGNIYEKSFKEIWEGEQRKSVMKKIESQGVSSCRENCRLESVNTFLQCMRNPPEHVNFI